MIWRLAARLVTGPVAFFVAGVIDVAAFGFGALMERIRGRVRGRVRGSPGHRH